MNYDFMYNIRYEFSVNPDLFAVYNGMFEEENKQNIKDFIILVCRRVQRQFQSQKMPFFIFLKADTVGSYYSPLSDIFNEARSNYNFAHSMNMYVRGPNNFNLLIAANRSRRHEFGEGTILYTYSVRDFPLGTDQVFKYFSLAVEFILSLKLTTIPIMKSLTEIASFRGLPPSPDFDFNKK